MSDSLFPEPEELPSSPFKILSQEEIARQQSLQGIIATYGGSRENLYGDSPLVSVFVQISGEARFTHTNFRLQIRQRVNSHDTFEMLCDPDEYGENQAYLLENSRKDLGKRITFTFKQWGKSCSLFTGVLTSISTRKKDGIKQIVLQGKSPSILMENGSHCRSFENQSLEEIIKEVIRDYPQNLINFTINPNHKEKIPYIVQYNETDFAFIQRLAARYGEYFYYDGSRFIFSPWGGKITELMEGEDVYDYELKMEVQPQHYHYSGYDPKQSQSYSVDSSGQSVEASKNPFQQYADQVSQKLFHVEPSGFYEQSLLPQSRRDIEQAVLRENKKRQNLIDIEVTSNNPNIMLGDIAKMLVWIPDHKIFKNGKVPIESYKITEIIHDFADGEGYTNTFYGVPKDLSVPFYTDLSNTPKADIQHAKVIDNKDPQKMGRVRVQFTWQQPSNSSTPWVQVIQPHSGGSKGTYFNPEIGEMVLCAFQGGNAECPVVLGTAYNGGEIAAYYTQGNDIKVIQTRSGTKIIFNDAQGKGSILIEDPSGNKMFMDGEGNISIHAPKNFSVHAGEDIKLSAGKNMVTNVGIDQTTSVGKNSSTQVGRQYSLFAADIYEEALGNISSKAKEAMENAQEKVTSTQGKTQFHSRENFKTNSGEKSRLF
ncbi:type VI secretion system Vgr family protein [Apibacter adventoris]|uniref:Rhs element Vgr protein n=1 Tax=Apibacter adventoris TaxID=1679466 RepID=A0A2S8AE79_9FLAO|nr:contractile injection system protein, VgrG/Pvc8 family [Apibacter adventoris]PQL93415.1 Rhs element Vgr protein [Apibacter adventoris]